MLVNLQDLQDVGLSIVPFGHFLNVSPETYSKNITKYRKYHNVLLHTKRDKRRVPKNNQIRNKKERVQRLFVRVILPSDEETST